MQDELVQVSHLFGEAGLAIAALLRGAELVLEQGIVLGADNGKVVAHRAAAPPHIGRGFCAEGKRRGSSWDRDAGDIDSILNDWRRDMILGRREGRVRLLWRIVVPTGAHAPQILEGPIRCN